MKFARGLLIFSYGLFTIAAQTLLFREFITTFEGNDISVGIFFGSWFLWVGLGAILVYRTSAFAEKLLENIDLLFLTYLPAFVLQVLLIVQARELAGVQSYARFPIGTVLLLSLLVNAPLSIITGMFFPLACRWVRQEGGVAVSRVYILEAAGSFAGGLGATILLAMGLSLARVFLLLAFVVCFSLFVAAAASVRQYREQPVSARRYKVKMAVQLMNVLLVPFCLAVGLDEELMGRIRAAKWAKLLPPEALEGSFQTAQAEYLYGLYQGQWVAVREGSTCETLPDHETAGRVAAISLCQKPTAKRILVVGSGLGLCYEFLRLPQIEDVTWAHCDSEYVTEVERFIPAELRIEDDRFHKLGGDVRTLLAEKEHYFDLVILDLPEATSSVLNRYYTLEFYRQIKSALGPGGVFGMRVPGGENIMGTELITLGASAKVTLEKTFSRVVLTPGEDTWFIASDSHDLTGDPGTLRNRFAAIDHGAEVLPPDALLSVYLPDRAKKALDSYAAADLPEDLLINRDSRPLAHLYSLLLAAKQSGAPAARFVKHLALAGPLAFIIPIVVIVVLRLVYVLRSKLQGGPSGFDSTFLIFSAGWIGIGVVITLMYLYQTRFGSLYLHIGVISSLFMVGVTLGALVLSSLTVPERRVNPQALLLVIIFLHTLILTAVALLPLEEWSHLSFGAAFVLGGFCTGCYFPLAARQLADAAFDAGRAGSRLETADHLGASAGGMLTSLALVPVLGTRLTLLVFILFILANVPLAALRIFGFKEKYSRVPARPNYRGAGYALFGMGLSIILCSNLLAAAGARLSPALPRYAAQALAGQAQIEPVSVLVDDKSVTYFEVYETQSAPNTPSSASQIQEPVGYVFSTEDMAGDVRGFGGKINLGVHLDTTGKLIDFHIMRSNETPAYLDLLTSWQDLLKGHQLFQRRPFASVDTVTGATVSSEAILEALTKSAGRFGEKTLGLTSQSSPQESTRRAAYVPDAAAAYFTLAVVLTLIVIYRGGFWSRLAVLLFNLIAGGIFLNAQYSSEQMATILSLHAPKLELSGVFLLAVAVPLLAAIFGNIYCGYLCPFGALQEVIGCIIPARFKQPLSRDKVRLARFIKYIVLFVVILIFFFSRNRTTLAGDPLISFFNLRSSAYDLQSAFMWIAAAALIGSLFYTRFWCRYLCPAGAFLSLFNNIVLLRRLIPAKKFAGCEFGLTATDRMDCIYCDKCRYETRPVPDREPIPPAERSQTRLLSHFLVAAAIIAAVFFSAVTLDRFRQVLPARIDYDAAFAASGGQPRDVDLEKVRSMIRQGKLSDKEAQFSEKAE